MNLRTNLLRGHIPWSLFELENLVTLDMGQNYISGTISAKIKLMSSLRIIDLESNVLSGTIPPEVLEMCNLQRLQLGKNALTGRLRSGLSGLPMITVLDLKDNRLSGFSPNDCRARPFKTVIFCLGTVLLALSHQFSVHLRRTVGLFFKQTANLTK